MAADDTDPKWEGKSTAKLHKPTPEAVWSLLEDFCSFHKWLPSIDTCYKVEGLEEGSGLVRYCASAPAPHPEADGGGEEEVAVKWCREKLVDIDPIGKWLSYELVDNNMGFKSYKSTIKVVPINGGDESGGCKIEWSFWADPVEGVSFEDMLKYFDFGVQGMAQNMEKALESS